MSMTAEESIGPRPTTLDQILVRTRRVLEAYRCGTVDDYRRELSWLSKESKLLASSDPLRVATPVEEQDEPEPEEYRRRLTPEQRAAVSEGLKRRYAEKRAQAANAA